MKTEEIQSLIEEIIQSSFLAGKSILEIYYSSDQGTKYKDDASPLTKADLASNTILCNALKRISPDIPIITEEHEVPNFEVRKNWDYFWMIDPLDGTKEFIKKNDEFTTNVALIHQNKTIAGVVHIPVSNEMYWAIEGVGAFEVINGENHQIVCRQFKSTDPHLGIVCSRSHLNDQTQTFIDQYDSPRLVTKGSSLKFLSIAKGEADIYPRLAPTMEWDTAAAQIILEEAGGSVRKVDSDETVSYNKENLLNPFFIAQGKLIS